MDTTPHLAVIGGSGLYRMSDLDRVEELHVDTPFGPPSSPVIVGRLEGTSIAFLARHGLGHRYSPTEVNYRANIYALKSLGVERVVSVTACGSLRDDYSPGDLVIPDQLFDFTKERKRTFFEGGLVAHVSVADPFCPDFSEELHTSVLETGTPVRRGGSLITVEGPRFSTRVESNTYRSWGISLIGMTTSPEAFLAREAEMCYSALAHVTDFDVWHISEEPVTAEMVFQIVAGNMARAQEAIRALARRQLPERACTCVDALASALSTAPEAIEPSARQRLSLLVDRHLPD